MTGCPGLSELPRRPGWTDTVVIGCSWCNRPIRLRDCLVRGDGWPFPFCRECDIAVPERTLEIVQEERAQTKADRYRAEAGRG
jgi:hypothetical protein